mmetsp:Transcript_19422/g.48635  ORF Transcript_19422/g.48635 Transcript_19422/m.48635 type:complete len:440 (-) Transcript_19422:116-1435(-)
MARSRLQRSRRGVCAFVLASSIQLPSNVAALVLREKVGQAAASASCCDDDGKNGKKGTTKPVSKQVGEGPFPIGKGDTNKKVPTPAAPQRTPGGPMLETSKGLTAITKNALAMTLEPYVPLGKPPAQAQAHPMDVINVPEYYNPKTGARSKERRGGAMEKIMRHRVRKQGGTNGRGPIVPIVYLLGDSILDSADYVLERPGAPGAISAEADRFSKLPRADLIQNFEQDFWFWHPYQMPDVPYWLNKNIRENKEKLLPPPIVVNAAQAGSILAERGTPGAARGTIANEEKMRVGPEDVFVVSVGGNDLIQSGPQGEPPLVQKVMNSLQVEIGGKMVTGVANVVPALLFNGGDMGLFYKTFARDVMREFTSHLWPDHLHPWLESLCTKSMPKRILMLSLPLSAPHLFKKGSLQAVPSSVFENLSTEMAKESVAELKIMLRG